MKELYHRFLLWFPLTRNYIRNKIEGELKQKDRMRVERNSKRIIDAWINEYNLIQEKKSKLSARQRVRVEDNINRLIKEGVIKIDE